MAIQLHDRGVQIRQYTNWELQRLRAQAGAIGYKHLLVEPPSGLFVTSATVTTTGILNAHDPGLAEVTAVIEPHWRPEAAKMVKRLRDLGINLVDIARTGGPYHTYGVKRIARWNRDQHPLILQTHKFWMRPWWRERGAKQVQDLLLLWKQRSMQNLERIILDPELAIGDKEPKTGTGWERPLNDRRGLADHAKEYATQIRETVEADFTDEIEGLNHWPENDVTWQLQGSMYKGIKGGVRSDATVTRWTPDDVQYVKVGVREVGNRPASSLHNRALNERAWREAIRVQFSSPRVLLPTKIETHIRLLTTPPVTQVDDNEYGVFSVDFGYQEPTPIFVKEKGQWVIHNPKEAVKFGADNIVQAGMFSITHKGDMIAHLKSGDPTTEIKYTPMVGTGIDAALSEAQITCWYASTGDDYHFIIKPVDVPALLGLIGPWMRTKGFTQNTNFIWGHQQVWKGKDHVTSFIVPRGIKTVSSPRVKEELGGMGPEERRVFEVERETQEQAANFWKQYEPLVIWDGRPDDYKTYLETNYYQGELGLAELGISTEWVEDLFKE